MKGKFLEGGSLHLLHQTVNAVFLRHWNHLCNVIHKSVIQQKTKDLRKTCCAYVYAYMKDMAI